jgi:hypothetical protein
MGVDEAALQAALQKGAACLDADTVSYLCATLLSAAAEVPELAGGGGTSTVAGEEALALYANFVEPFLQVWHALSSPQPQHPPARYPIGALRTSAVRRGFCWRRRWATVDH